MPTITGYFGCPLDGLSTTTANGLTVTVNDAEDGTAVCAVRLTRSELRDILELADLLASAEDTIDLPRIALADGTGT